jgi:cytochrome oxidase Cu insertion factor (SCO1/SenC/PrrC family)
MNEPSAAPEQGPRPGAALLLWASAVVVWWGFAFFPTAPGDDSWVAVAQSACFGSIPGGLPAVQGWIMLTLAPLLLLGALLAAYHGDLRAALPQVVRSHAWRLGVLVLVSAFAVEAGWATTRILRDRRVTTVSFEPVDSGPLPDFYPRTAIDVPAFRLVDQSGAVFDAAQLKGRPTVLSFVFAHCQTVCPVLVRSLTSAARELGPEAAGMALVTMDPWRDTPGALPALAERFALPPGAHLVSGEPDDVCRLLDTLQVARERDLRSGDVSHAPLVMIVDAQGRIAYRFNNPTAGWIVEGVRRVRAGS